MPRHCSRSRGSSRVSRNLSTRRNWVENGGKTYRENGGLRADVEFVGYLGEPVQEFRTVLRGREGTRLPISGGFWSRGCAARRLEGGRDCVGGRESTGRRERGRRRATTRRPATWEGKGRSTSRGSDDDVVCDRVDIPCSFGVCVSFCFVVDILCFSVLNTPFPSSSDKNAVASGIHDTHALVKETVVDDPIDPS